VHDMSCLEKCMDLIRLVSNRINYQRVNTQDFFRRRLGESCLLVFLLNNNSVGESDGGERDRRRAARLTAEGFAFAADPPDDARTLSKIAPVPCVQPKRPSWLVCVPEYF
jgi:hypothetical protein